MRILLINPPNCGRSIPEEEFGIDSIKMIFRGEPLALEVIAGNLEGHDVSITDLKAAPDSLDKYLDSSVKPDIIGITGVTCEANAMLFISEKIKKRYIQEKNSPIVTVGGHHASCDPEYFNKKFIDYVVVGIGKKSFRDLVDCIENKRSPDNIPGIGKTTDVGPLKFTPRKYTIEDLVDDKPPRYDLVQSHRDKYVMSGVGGKIGFVSTAFGCTHKCFFCSIPNITGGKYISHSIDAAIRDIKLLGDIDLIRFVDANTFGDIILAKDFARCLIDAGLNKKIVADVRADTVVKNPELFQLWKKAGLMSVVIGFEEIQDERLKKFNKKSSNSLNIEALSILKELGIKVIGDFIISPDYKENDFENLSKFITSHTIDLPVPSILTPLPGTELYRTLKNKIIIHNLDYYTFSNAVIETKLDTKTFYTHYANLMKMLHKHITN